MEALEGAGVDYLSEPLTENLHVTGRLTCWLQADVPDFDIEARLYEFGDGPAILVCDDRRRARHAASPRTSYTVANRANRPPTAG